MSLFAVSRFFTVVAFLFTLLSAGRASGQIAPLPPPEASPVSIAVNGGLSAASRGNGVAAGMQLTFDLTDRIVLEAEGAHVSRGAGASGMSGTISVLVNLLPGGGKTVPYLALGGGLYGASFDLDDQRYVGRMVSTLGMGGFGTMQGPYSGSPMPGFYANRLGQMTVRGDGRWGMRSFVDPAISIGAGVRLELSPRFSVRPDARVLVVLANGTSHTIGVMTIGVGYRF